MLRCSTLFAVAALLGSDALTAGPVPFLDPHFGGADGIARVGFEAGGAFDDRAVAAVWADGKLLMGGAVEVGESLYDYALARIDGTTGMSDPTFGNGSGRVLTGLGPISELTDVAVAADGRILYTGISALTVCVVGRRHPDGSVDSSFNGNGHRFLGPGVFIDGGSSLRVHRVTPLPDGKLLITGYATASIETPNPQVCAAAARLHPNGSNDSSFGQGRGAVCVAPAMQSHPMAGAYDAKVLPDGRILLAGTAIHPGGSGFDMAVARLLPDGAIDTTFGPAGNGWAFVGFDQGDTLNDVANAVTVDQDGRILLAGGIEAQGGYHMAIARLTPDGQLDPSFSDDGRVPMAFNLGGHNYQTAYNVHALPDGRVLVGGLVQVNSAVGAAVMLMPTGEFDTRFGQGGKFLQNDPEAEESARLIASRVLLEDDHVYMVGDAIHPELLPGFIRNHDFATTRFVLPLFADSFDEASPVH